MSNSLTWDLIMETYVALGIVITSMIHNPEPFIYLSYAGIIMLFSLDYFLSRRSRQILYQLYNTSYRFTLILLRLNLIGEILGTPYRIIGLNDKIISISVQIFLFESSNALSIIAVGKKITSKRFIYTLCHVSVLSSLMVTQQSFIVMLLFINHITDVLRDIMYFLGIHDFTKIFYFIKYLHINLLIINNIGQLDIISMLMPISISFICLLDIIY